MNGVFWRMHLLNKHTYTADLMNIMVLFAHELLLQYCKVIGKDYEGNPTSSTNLS